MKIIPIKKQHLLSSWLAWCVLWHAVDLCAINLTDLTIEELINIEVTTLSRKAQTLSDAAAPVYVLTSEDLQRSGVRTLPDALRLVPGLFVAQVDANKWVVTSRGFSGLFANKLLVLIDGRSVYTPLFSGVFWETQDVLIEDIARIEVIRGPGGALWGANAVNGIINVITKSTAETLGGQIAIGGGSEARGFGHIRYGKTLGKKGAFRIFFKGFHRDASKGMTAVYPDDDWHLSRVGIQWDHGNAFHFQGQLYRGEVGQTLKVTTAIQAPFSEIIATRAAIRGGHALGRWEHAWHPDHILTIQAYYDRSEREEFILQGAIETLDFDLHHQFALGQRLETVWGVGYRQINDHFDGTFTLSMQPDHRRAHLFSGFIQQDIWLQARRLRSTLGVKFEHNSDTGIEWQPSARLWWSPHKSHIFWASIARAVRTPSRADRSIRGTYVAFPADSLFQGAPPALALFEGNPNFRSEVVRACDLGYRTGHLQPLFIDLATFYNVYRDLRSTEPLLSDLKLMTDPLHFTVPVRPDNLAKGKTWGAELAADWQAQSNWRLRLAYSFFDMDLSVDTTSADVVTPTFAHETPAHQLSLRSQLALSPHLEINVIGRCADGLPTQHIDPYITCDFQTVWQAASGFTLTLVGRNLLQTTHAEFISAAASTLPSYVEREVFGAVHWAF